MRIINISEAAASQLSGDEISELQSQVGTITLIHPFSGYGFVSSGVEHVFIEHSDDEKGKIDGASSKSRGNLDTPNFNPDAWRKLFDPRFGGDSAEDDSRPDLSELDKMMDKFKNSESYRSADSLLKILSWENKK